MIKLFAIIGVMLLIITLSSFISIFIDWILDKVLGG